MIRHVYKLGPFTITIVKGDPMPLPEAVQNALDKLAESDAAKDAAVITLQEKQTAQAVASQATADAAADLQSKTDVRAADYAALVEVLVKEYQD